MVSAPNKKRDRLRNYQNLALVLLLALGSMAPAINNDFLNWDDHALVTENRAVIDKDGLKTIWTNQRMGVEFPNYPLTFSTYWLEYRLWADSPMGYHAVNIVLHAINSMLALLLLSRLNLGRPAAFLAAALFAAHPMQVESVAWIAERKNVLFTCFSLLTLLGYIRFRCANHAGWYLLALLSFSAAVLSKTAAVTEPLTMLFTDGYLQKRVSLTRFWGLLPFFVISLIAGFWVCSIEQPPAVPIDGRFGRCWRLVRSAFISSSRFGQ